MPYKKGFTLVEIVVTLIIVSILAAISLPSYITYTQQASSRAAQNNLIAIFNAEKTYYMANAAYCTVTTGLVIPCGNTLTNINTHLALNVTDSVFSYSCTVVNGFTCTATNNADANLFLTVTGGPPTAPQSIVLLGGAGCATSTGANCNPSCATDNAGYCPNT